jgi:predicted nucleic acid-binding protein
MTPYVVDSSIVFKWYRQPGDEDYVPQAVSILEHHLHGDLEIHVPDLLFYELGNILRFKETLVSKDALTILRETYALALQMHSIGLLLAEETFRFAREYDVTFYDASFVALSHLLQASFITADKKLSAKTRTLPTVIFLGNLS